MGFNQKNVQTSVHCGKCVQNWVFHRWLYGLPLDGSVREFESATPEITKVNPLARSGYCTSEMVTKRLTRSSLIYDIHYNI